ncbi:transposase [Actinoplanes sp. L3-i22]|nr:transposase [Actinoplanes sp. L3-i22]
MREVGVFLGTLAARDLAARCAGGTGHSSQDWARRKRELTGESSARWAGAITKATNAQWALARRAQTAHLADLAAGIAAIDTRLGLPLGRPTRAPETRKRPPAGYASRQEWFRKARRLVTARHHLDQAGLTLDQWRQRWADARMFLTADGESGKRFGNETIRVTPDGQVSIRLPARLAHLANAPRSRYVLAIPAAFAHRGADWRDRVNANLAVAYTIRHDPGRDRWYLTAAWQLAPTVQPSLAAAVAGTVIGVDTNDDHYAAWRLDTHGNPVGAPRRFGYDLSENADHRDGQIRHATTRLLHWARQQGVTTIAIENLDFTDSRGRERFGRNKRFRRLVSRFPAARLRARLIAQADLAGVTIVAVDPAYTSKWGAEHWQRPTSTPHHKTSRHEAASLVIGRRAQGHAARRRTGTPAPHRSDGVRPRPAPATAHLEREGPRPARPAAPTRSVQPPGQRKRATSLSNTVRDRPSTQDVLMGALDRNGCP